MKKFNMSSLMTGFTVSIWYCVIECLLCNLPYSENFEILQNSMFFILPAISGVLTIIFLRRDTLKSFFVSFAIYFVASVLLINVYMGTRLHKLVHFWLGGYEEFGLGCGLLVFVIMRNHLISCIIGLIISGIISSRRENKLHLNRT